MAEGNAIFCNTRVLYVVAQATNTLIEKKKHHTITQ